MRKVLIVVDSDFEGNSQPGVLPDATAQMVSALQQAILQSQREEKGDRSSPFPQKNDTVQVISAATLAEKIKSGGSTLKDDIFCPLTLYIPADLSFPGQSIVQKSRDIEGLRQTVSAWGYPTGTGNFWLPVALTAKGPLYAEVIGKETSPSDPAYTQPIHLSDAQRQSLYELGFQLLRSLQAHPSVYLIQFGFEDETIWFDRLFPFPAEPAIASLQVQQPDLFTCHWYCLTHQPLRELSIAAMNPE